MHYDDMFLFVQLIEKGSFSMLSRHTGMTQSTISRRISGLEEYLKVQLLKRNTRGLFEPTDEGVKLFTKCKSLVDEINLCVDDIQKSNDYSGVLRVAMPKIFFDLFIIPVIHQFQEQYSNIRLIFSYSASDIDLLKDNLDIAIAIRLPKNQNYKQRLLISSNDYLYANTAYIDKHGMPQSLTDLTAHQIIGNSVEHTVYDQLIALDKSSGQITEINFLPKLVTNNALSNLDFALNGGYIINATEYLVQNAVDSGKLTKLLPNYSFGETKFYLLRHNRISNKLEQVFIDFINNIFLKNPN